MNKTVAKILFFGLIPLWIVVILLYDLLHIIERYKQ